MDETGACRQLDSVEKLDNLPSVLPNLSQSHLWLNTLLESRFYQLFLRFTELPT